MVSITMSVGSAFSFTPANKEIAQIKKSLLALPEEFTVTAHAGAMLTRANSMWSVKQIAASDADVTEFDVTFRPDGTPVIRHDETPSARQGTPLSEALAVVAEQGSMKINLDLKAFWNLPAVQELVEQAGMLERVFFTGVGREQTARVRQDCPKIPYYLNASVAGDTEDAAMLHALADEVKALGAIGINLHYAGASRALCEVMHEQGLLVSVWTVNGRLDMHEMLAVGPDNITTKRPNKLLKVMELWGEQ
jgi:glycerophosphoryl diester phosphodiesterase